MEQYHHVVTCAAITNGCQSMLAWKSFDNDKEMSVARLTDNGWRLDHGKWVCGNHPEKAEPKIHESHSIRFRSDAGIVCIACYKCLCHDAAKLEAPCEKNLETTKPIPVIYYGDSQKGRQIGTAIIKDGSISASITDEAVSEMIKGDVLKHVSFGYGFKEKQRGDI